MVRSNEKTARESMTQQFWAQLPAAFSNAVKHNIVTVSAHHPLQIIKKKNL
jgi:hypothetical protein